MTKPWTLWPQTCEMFWVVSDVVSNTSISSGSCGGESLRWPMSVNGGFTPVFLWLEGNVDRGHAHHRFTCGVQQFCREEKHLLLYHNYHFLALNIWYLICGKRRKTHFSHLPQKGESIWWLPLSLPYCRQHLHIGKYSLAPDHPLIAPESQTGVSASAVSNSTVTNIGLTCLMAATPVKWKELELGAMWTRPLTEHKERICFFRLSARLCASNKERESISMTGEIFTLYSCGQLLRTVHTRPGPLTAVLL